MTEHLKITAKIPRKRYVANGSQTVFSFDFVLFQPSELLVTVNGVAVASGVAVALLAVILLALILILRSTLLGLLRVSTAMQQLLAKLR